MLINDIDSLEIELLETEEANEFITVIVREANTSTEVGRLRILKKRYSTFLLALNTMIRSVYNEFQERERSISKLDNQKDGTIDFIEE